MSFLRCLCSGNCLFKIVKKTQLSCQFYWLPQLNTNEFGFFVVSFSIGLRGSTPVIGLLLQQQLLLLLLLLQPLLLLVLLLLLAFTPLQWQWQLPVLVKSSSNFNDTVDILKRTKLTLVHNKNFILVELRNHWLLYMYSFFVSFAQAIRISYYNLPNVTSITLTVLLLRAYYDLLLMTV